MTKFGERQSQSYQRDAPASDDSCDNIASWRVALACRYLAIDLHRLTVTAMKLLCIVICTTICTAAPPNIVVFLSDDHTLIDSSLYGASDLSTPNMERIAADGMTFQHAFVASPSCAPSRAALLTGLMPSRNGAEANHSRPHQELKKLPAYLQELGYEVVAFGKVGHYAQTTEYGFDLAKHYSYHEDIAIPAALDWLRTRDAVKPLCLFVGTNWPHVPWPEESTFPADAITIPSIHVDTPATRSARAKYYAAIQTMDRELGQVFDLAYEKLGQNTLFVHTSDHGAQWPFAKWNLYDQGIRTPLLVTWPGKVEKNSTTDAMVSWVDLLPTFVAAAGGNPDPTLDGASLLPVLSGAISKHRDAIFAVHSGDGRMNVFPSRSVRTERYKLIWNLHPEFRYTSHVTEVEKDGNYWKSWVEKAATDSHAKEVVDRYQQRVEYELYDLQADPLEQTNLVNDPAHSETLKSLRSKLIQWMASQGDTKTTFGPPTLRE